MSNAFLKALSKMKLVELDEEEQKAVAKDEGSELTMEEIDRILAEEDKANAAKAAGGAAPAPAAHPRQAAAAPAPTPSATPSAAGGSGAITEDIPFDTLYSAAGTPPSTYPAEKLLKVLEGLKAMPPETRKAAVLAMDAADDAWSVADAVLDAERKIAVLEKERASLAQQVQSLAAHAEAEKSKRDQYIAQASESIRQQIQDLESKLQAEAAKMAQEKAELDAKVETARAAASREEARLGGEAQRLREVPQVFAISRTP